MITFRCVDEFNEDTPENTTVIRWPDFMDEIKSCERFKGSFNRTTVNYIRSIAAEFGYKHDKTFSPYRNIVPTDYCGIDFSSHGEVSSIISRMFTNQYPKIFKKYLESMIVNRPFNCEHLVIVGFNKDLVNETVVQFGLIEEQPKTSTQEPTAEPEQDDAPELLEALADTDKPKVPSKKTRKNS